MRENIVKSRRSLTTCCCFQVIKLALELEVDPVFRKIGGGGREWVGGILVGEVKGLDEAQGGLVSF